MKKTITLKLINLCLALAVVIAVLPAMPRVTSVRAETNLLTISVVSARTELNHPGGPVTVGDLISTYQYLINVDNTGDPTQPRTAGCSPDDPGYPDSCDWPSIRVVPGAAPIFTQGNQDDFNGVLNSGLSLPEGKYLISVLADGYKIGGAHFTVPLPDPDPQTGANVLVELQPHPLPSATMRIKVFDDISPTNGQIDVPAEQGLVGAKVTINDILGQVSTDVFGNPLCTQYDANGDPIPGGTDACLYSDVNGDITVPNLGPNRYDVLVTPPQDGQNWIQTTTLEGSHSWDTWLQEGGTGLDNEFVVAGEPFPWTVFGFVSEKNTLAGGTGGVMGTILAASFYVPEVNGLPYYGSTWGGLNGAKVTGPIADAWVALSDLQQGDTAVYVGPANQNGEFVINNVPDGNYMFTYWDYRQHYILDWMQITVSDGQMTDLATPFLTGWFTWVEGYVFDDLNSNGKRDAGEPGISDYLIVLKDRDNTEIDRMTIAVTTDATGHYFFDRAYPMGSWMILEAYNDRYYTTGITYQVENQPTETTVLGNGVDVGILPILGHTGRLDWGVKPYEPGTNGGIVGTVFYDTTRNELDPQYAAVEGWSAGIPGLTVNLWQPIACGTNPGTPCDASGLFELATDGSIAKGKLLNSAVTEIYEQPVDCQARDADGNPVDQYALPPSTGGFRCLEAPMTGLQFQSGFATLDGNYGFTDGCFGEGGFDPQTGTCVVTTTLPTPLPAGDYLVETVIPTDTLNRPLYKVTKEEDINVFGGDEFTIQIPPPACAGPLHTVDVEGSGTDIYGPITLPNGIVVMTSTLVTNPSFADAGGSPFEGMVRPSCDTKLVTVSSGRSIAPSFTLFTDVPIPGKWKGYIIDDLTLATDPQQLFFGEKAGMDSVPVGIYDFTNKLLTTIQSDPNGTFEVLLPSTYTINCPSPSGVCPGVYYLLGNDPGQPGRLNPNYNPQYRTIGASFEIYPGAWLPSDLAPTQIGVSFLAPGSNVTVPALCTLSETTPQLFSVSQPYMELASPIAITIAGQGLGANTGQVTLDGTTILPITSWSNNEVVVTIPTTTPAGPHQLMLSTDTGLTNINGLTFHVLGGSYNPVVYEVGPGRGYSTIQSAVDTASAANPGNSLVVVYPDTPTQWNPYGIYYENIVIYDSLKLQGVGPGGVRADSSFALGSVIDGRGITGDTAAAEDWRTLVSGLTWDGNQTIYEGAVVTILAQDGEFIDAFKPAIDGLTIQGGDQQGFPGVQPGAPVVTIQGGGIYANAYARYLQITNNILRSNGGAYGGAIRLGTPHLPGTENDNQNDFVRIAYNRIFANGGTNLAGAIGLFSGSEGYEIDHNDICGNFSAEYGGGISHYGFSPASAVHHNRIYFNRAYDEAGGIMIAGELPADPSLLSPGSGSVDIYSNLIQANLGNDDGGGVRFLMSGNFPFNVYNNIIVNNISTHEGGGISINDAPDVRIYNNTIMKNITTATAVTSLGSPAPAGVSSSQNSALLQATLPSGSPIFSNPLVFNNIFWDNRAGTWNGGFVSGIGMAGDVTPIENWDLGVADTSGLLSPISSILQVETGIVSNPSNLVGSDPLAVGSYDSEVVVLPWRGHPRFVDTLMIAQQLPIELLGNYHIADTSPAVNAGVASANIGALVISAPGMDIDSNARPSNNGYEIGADELAGPVYTFPMTPVLDNFNRANGKLGTNWGGDVGQAVYRILGNQVQVRSSGAIWWRAASFGANQEAYYTFTKVGPTATNQALILKMIGNSPNNARASLIQVSYNQGTSNVEIWTKALTQGWVLRASLPATFVAGDTLGAQTFSDGTVIAFKNGVSLGSVNLTTGLTPWPTALVTGGGRIGVQFIGPSFLPPNDARFDNFGGGTLP